ncbi:hypothetical protein [uncultured Akkermansia sp.]|uniref:hypothetical protein n=1 Tax=Akkermansia sp. TaxID=1872421 RepID=UPI0025F695B3|nr:hypothetical protein [uncultured Akkermansia sp.]
MNWEAPLTCSEPGKNASPEANGSSMTAANAPVTATAAGGGQGLKQWKPSKSHAKKIDSTILKRSPSSNSPGLVLKPGGFPFAGKKRNGERRGKRRV